MPLSIAEYVPQTNQSRRPLIIWLIASATALLLVVMIVGAPLAAADHHNSLAQTIYRAFGTLCHQLPDRSFFIAGHKFAVCARCTGLYAGFTLVLILYPLLRPLRSVTLPRPKWLFIACSSAFCGFCSYVFWLVGEYTLDTVSDRNVAWWRDGLLCSAWPGGVEYASFKDGAT